MAKFQAGTAGIIQWIDASGTVWLNPNFTEGAFNQTGETVDTTSGAATWDTHNPARQNWEITLKMFFDNAGTASSGGTADLKRLVANTMGVIAIGQQGTATGAQKLGGSVTVTKNENAFPFAEPSVIDLSFKGNGQPYWNFGSAWA